MNDSLSAPPSGLVASDDHAPAAAVPAVFWPATDPAPQPRRSEGSSPLPGVVVGRLVGLSVAGEPLVESPSGPVVARTTVAPGPDDIGRDVVLVFERGDPLKPIILGVLVPPPRDAPPPVRVQASEATLDDERLVLTARKEIVVRCGEASITLTRAGKILIRGAHVVSRSSGANHIKGGSVQIN